MTQTSLLYGFHAVIQRIKSNPHTVLKISVNENRQDKRMQQLLDIAKVNNISISYVNNYELDNLLPKSNHQGVIAKVNKILLEQNIDIILDNLEEKNITPLLLILDEVTDPHNLGACFRIADGAGVHAIISCQNNSCAINDIVNKVASGACDNIPYIKVVNLGRIIKHLQSRGLWVIGTSDKADKNLYNHNIDFSLPLAWVMGSEGQGIRLGIQQKCDFLISIPMHGIVSSLNIATASAVCLFETIRKRHY